MAPSSGPSPDRPGGLDEFEMLLAAPADDQGEPPRHGRGRRERRRIWPLVLGLVLALLLAVGGAGYFAYATYPDQVKALFGYSNDYDGAGTTAVAVEIRPGDLGSDVARTLEAKGVTKSSAAFYDLLVKTSPEPSLEPGTYELKLRMSAAAALSALQDDANRVQTTVAIPEGSTMRQILKAAASATGLPLKDFTAIAEDQESLGVPKSAPNLEGWLFPATYDFQPGTSAQEVLQTMVDRTKQSLDDAGVAESDREEVLTLAGLVQKEGNGEDDAKVARVFLNRIEADMPLQSDATVSYGAGGTTVVPTSKQYRDKNPYNTYLRTGLPAGPISSPGDQAIDAALHPAKGNWLYFVTVNLKTGKTVFSHTLAEHDRAAAEFSRWLKANPDYAK